MKKFLLGLVAAATLCIGTLIPGEAQARWGYGYGYPGGGYYSGYGGYGYGGCYVRRLVPTPWGPRWRLINRCY